MTRLAIFDCDGTLVDSQANICRAVEEALRPRRAIAVPSRDAIRRIVGLSLVEAMQALVPDAADADHRTLAQGYKDKFFAMRASGALADEPLFDGIGAIWSSASPTTAGCSASPPASPIAGSRISSTDARPRSTISSRCRPPTATRPSRTRR